MLAVLVDDQYQVRPAEITGLAQFGREAPGLVDGFFRIRKALPDVVGKEFRAVDDVKKILRHGQSLQNLGAGDSFWCITPGCLLD
jgi:hypothetical protein